MQDPSQTDTTSKPADSPAQKTAATVETPMVSVNIEKGPIEVEASDLTISQEATSPEIAVSQPDEITIPHELSNIVEKGPDAKEFKIDDEVLQAEVTQAKESTPVIRTPTGEFKSPMSYIQALKKEKESKSLDSVHWLAALILYLGAKYEPDAVRDAKHNLK